MLVPVSAVSRPRWLIIWFCMKIFFSISTTIPRYSFNSSDFTAVPPSTSLTATQLQGWVAVRLTINQQSNPDSGIASHTVPQLFWFPPNIKIVSRKPVLRPNRSSSGIHIIYPNLIFIVLFAYPSGTAGVVPRGIPAKIIQPHLARNIGRAFQVFPTPTVVSARLICIPAIAVFYTSCYRLSTFGVFYLPHIRCCIEFLPYNVIYKVYFFL